MKKNIIAVLLASAAGVSFAGGAMHDQGSAAADYKSAMAKCTGMKGDAKKVCTEEARAARAHAHAEAVAKASKSQSEINKARIAAVEADYGLARARCAEMKISDKDDCLATARKAHANAVADVRAGREWSQMGASRAGATGVSETRAISRCEALTGDSKAACLIDNRTSPTATEMRSDAARAMDRTEDAAERAADRAENATERAARRTDDVAENAAQRTENAAERAADRTRSATARAADNTRDAAAEVAQETREATATAREKTKDVAATAAVKTERAAEKTGRVIADATVTTKVKGALLAEQALKSLDVHVETEQGVVMLSGFVQSKQQADRAVQIAKGIEGVKTVRSALTVK